MGWIWTILIGFIAGAIAKLLMPGKDPGGFIITALLGIGGSILATWLGRTIGWYAEGSGAGFVAAVLGAVLILWIYRLFKAKSAY